MAGDVDLSTLRRCLLELEVEIALAESAPGDAAVYLCGWRDALEGMSGGGMLVEDLTRRLRLRLETQETP